MRQIILGSVFMLALFFTQAYFYAIEVFWTFFLGGTLAAFFVRSITKSVKVFYAPIVFAFTTIIIVTILEGDVTFPSEIYSRIALMLIAILLPLSVRNSKWWLKLSALMGFIVLTYLNHEFAINQNTESILTEKNNPIRGLIHMVDSTDFLPLEDTFFAFTYNSSCGGCVALVRQIKKVRGNKNLPIYPIKLVLKRDKEPLEIPNYIKELDLPPRNYLVADSTKGSIHGTAAPLSIYKNKEIIKTHVGYSDDVMDQLFKVFGAGTNFWTKKIPESWYIRYAPWLFLVLAIVLFAIPKQKT